jgi:hypothetical protein
MSNYTLILNSSNVVQNSNNTSFKLNFINGNLTIKKNSKICISQIQYPYSIFNISSAIGNNKYTFNFPNSSGSTLYTIVLTDGFYTITDINYFLQSFCIANNLYLSSSGQNVYFLNWAYNIQTYGVQLICYAVPTSANAATLGYTVPTGGSFNFPVANTTPQVNILNTNTFYKIIGFVPDVSYPAIAQSTNFNAISTLTPQGSQVNSIVVRCNLVNNNAVVPSDILDSFPIDSPFGSNISYNPTFEKFVDLVAGTYSSLIITLQDQNLNSFIALDSNAIITLIIKSD